MKKKLFLFVLIIASVQIYADTRAQALLLHNGQGKSFDADQLQQAVNEAVAGDTICLSAGTFMVGNADSDTLILDKAVSMIGAGEMTILAGNINIAIDGEPSYSNFCIDGIKLVQSIVISKKMHGLRISKCFMLAIYATDAVTGLQMDRCFATSFLPNACMKSAVITNSIFSWITTAFNLKFNSQGCDLNFNNCNIGQVSECANNDMGEVHDATFTNCIIQSIYRGKTPNDVSNNIYVNCLVAKKIPSGNVVNDCYVQAFDINRNATNYNFPTFTSADGEITQEWLQTNKYLGTDGTIVGAYGGATPYSLTPDGISIKESVLHVDPETRKLNVTLKVATE
jgi:hypothetical protein